jgi:cell wall-associated NlpC family hydrolase
MRKQVKSVAMAALLCGSVLSAFGQQSETERATGSNPTRHGVRTGHLLTPDDGLAVISSALDTQRHFASNRDCSHLVHAIYQRAGFPYEYATADDLYDGVAPFRRVFHPQIGDLIVWHGHVGIIVRPSQHVFFSFLSKGPATDNYRSAYWIGRGQARFYRYIKR